MLMTRRTVVLAALLGGLVAPLIGSPLALAQAPAATVRIALISQWVVSQHGSAGPALRSALDGGVVDHTVFRWQRGAIGRDSLVAKPVRVLSGPEAAELGGRGEFQLVGVRPPAGSSAWTTVEIAARTGQPSDVLVLELGGERHTVTQVLESLFVGPRGGDLVRLPVARAALIPGRGVQVIYAPFERPVVARPDHFREVEGVAILVARSLTDYTRNGAIGPSGPADTSSHGAGDWREGDRVLLRIPLATLQAGAPEIVLGWKDRILRPDPDTEFPRRSSLPLPLTR
jgi:hypothetical protein